MAGVVVIVIFVLFGALIVLAFRWSRPAPSAPDLHRADEAQAEDLPDATTVMDRVRSYVTIYGWKR